MRRLPSLAAFLALVPLGLAVCPARAAETKIGYIDSHRILKEFRGTTDVQREFDKEVETWRKQAQDKKKEIEDLKVEIDKQSLILSDEAKKERETQVADKQREYEEFVQQTFGPGGKLEQRDAELTKPLVEKINKVLEKLGGRRITP